MNSPLLEKIKLPLIILVLGFVGFFVYKNFFATPEVGDLTQQNVSDNQAMVDAQTETFRRNLDELNSIKFDTNFTESKEFQSLQDNTARALQQRDAALSAYPPGSRANPFTPIER